MVNFDNNCKGYIIEIGNICITPSIYIKNILLIDGLKYNLFSISQLYDKRFKVSFESSMYIIFSPNNNGIVFVGYRHGNIYMVDQDNLPMKNS